MSVKGRAEQVAAILSLASFIRHTWHVLEPANRLAWNWHIDVICAELEHVTSEHAAGRGVDLVICIPPGHAKSLIASVFWPAWQWLRRPSERTLHFANDDDLVKRDSRRTRDLIVSAEYGALQSIVAREGVAPRLSAALEAAGVPRLAVWGMKYDQNEKANFENDYSGFRVCKGIRATVTGKRGDGLIIDDPYDAKEVVLGSPSTVARRMREVVETFDGVLSSRLNDQGSAYRVLIMQRLHAADLAGVLLTRPGVRSVILPTEYDPDRADRHPSDPRTTHGELLFPAKFGAAVVAKRRSALGPRHYAAQDDQRPTVAGGRVFREAWFRRYTFDPQRQTPNGKPWDQVAVSVDCTFKGGDSSDFVVMQVWGRQGTDRYLLDQVRERLTFTETFRALRAVARKWPIVRLILIEDKANGPAVIDALRAVLSGVVPFDPGDASKQARAELAALDFEAGHVWIPADAFAYPWIVEYVRELTEFPNAPHDDQVDATSQIILRWSAPGSLDVRRDFAFLLEDE